MCGRSSPLAFGKNICYDGVNEKERGTNMVFEYAPKGVCARKFTIEVEDGKIGNIAVMGGCSGNLQGLAALLKGMKVEDAIERMQGIRCGFKSTSCPDQMAQALKSIL